MAVKRLKILALMHDILLPPEDGAGYGTGDVDWKMEYDVTVTLRELAHEVCNLGVGNELSPILEKVEEWQPDIVFNLLEDFYNIPTFDQNVVSYLELLRVPYTGCNPRGLLLGRDKALSKKLLHYHRVPVPEFAVFPMNRKVRRPKKLQFPLIVKSLIKEASAGLSQASIVDSDEKLAERVRFMHEHIGTDAIAEQYIDGRELYVGVLGNYRTDVFPVWELLFKKWPEDTPRIATDLVKSNRAYQKKRGITTDEAKDLPIELSESIRRVCKRAYRDLGLSGYARIDLRLTPEGRFYILEANPNPQLAYGEDFAESAERSGISYEDLLQRIVRLGLRWHPARGSTPE